jgi:putative heme transporter
MTSTGGLSQPQSDVESPARRPIAAPGPAAPARAPKLGVWSWSFVGVVSATVIVVLALGAVSEIVLPMTFAAVLAVCFRPVMGTLQRHRLRPTLAAGLIVLGLLAVAIGVVVATARGIGDQRAEISAVTDAAISEAGDEFDTLGIDEAALEDARVATENAAPMISSGAVARVVDVFDSVVAIASGVILGSLIMYYLLKDGSSLRRSVVSNFGPNLRDDIDGFIGDACRILRDYGKGRTVMSAIISLVVGVAAVMLGLPLVFTIVAVNFIGGYIPYIGAFLGGGLAVIVALGDGGLTEAVIMLAVVLASNLLLENFVEPKVMGRTLEIHPLVVLVVTALGGLLGGIVGLILAVPAWVIAQSAFGRFRSRNMAALVADRAQPAVDRLLQ